MLSPSIHLAEHSIPGMIALLSMNDFDFYCIIRDIPMQVCKWDTSAGAEMCMTNTVKQTTVTCLAAEIMNKTVVEAWQTMYMKYVSKILISN